MKNKLLSSKKGFTLVEMVVVIAVISILSSVALSSFSSSMKRYQQTLVKEQILQAKDSFFVKNDISLSDFVHFYFECDGVVYKGQPDGSVAVFNDFDLIDKSTLTIEFSEQVTIYFPAQEALFSVEIWLETDVGSNDYGSKPYHTDHNMVGFVGRKTNVVAQDLAAKGYVANDVEQQTIKEDNSTVVKVYYSKIIVGE